MQIKGYSHLLRRVFAALILLAIVGMVLAPQGGATRAETAIMLMRFVELTK